MEKKFSVGEVFGYGFNTVIDNAWLLILSLLACAGTYLLLWASFVLLLALVFFTSCSTPIMNIFIWGKVSFITLSTIPFSVFLIIFIGMLFFLVIFWGLKAGFINLMFKIHDTGEGSVGDIFTRFYLAPRLFAAAILFGLILLGGLILLIIPGIYWAIRFSLFPYFIVDKELGAIEALRHSYRATAHYEWSLLAIFLLLVLLVAIPIIGGTLFFFMLPIVMVYIYRKLTSQPPIIPPSIPV